MKHLKFEKCRYCSLTAQCYWSMYSIVQHIFLRLLKDWRIYYYMYYLLKQIRTFPFNKLNSVLTVNVMFQRNIYRPRLCLYVCIIWHGYSVSLSQWTSNKGNWQKCTLCGTLWSQELMYILPKGFRLTIE